MLTDVVGSLAAVGPSASTLPILDFDMGRVGGGIEVHLIAPNFNLSGRIGF